MTLPEDNAVERLTRRAPARLDDVGVGAQEHGRGVPELGGDLDQAQAPLGDEQAGAQVPESVGPDGGEPGSLDCWAPDAASPVVPAPGEQEFPGLVQVTTSMRDTLRIDSDGNVSTNHWRKGDGPADAGLGPLDPADTPRARDEQAWCSGCWGTGIGSYNELCPDCGGHSSPRPVASHPRWPHMLDGRRYLSDLRPRQRADLPGAKARVRHQAYDEAVAGLIKACADFLYMEDCWRPNRVYDAPELAEAEGRVREQMAVLDGIAKARGQHGGGGVDGVGRRPADHEVASPPPHIRALQLAEAQVPEVGQDVAVPVPGAVTAGAGSPLDAVLDEPARPPLGESLISALVRRQAMTRRKLALERLCLPASGEPLRAMTAPVVPRDAPGLPGTTWVFGKARHRGDATPDELPVAPFLAPNSERED